MLCQNSAHTSYGATSQKNAHKYISDNKSAHFAVWFTQVEICGCIFATLGWSSFRALTCAAQFEMCIFSELALAYFPSITIVWCAHIFVGSLSGQFETSAERRVCTPAIPLELTLPHTCTHCARVLCVSQGNTSIQTHH